MDREDEIEQLTTQLRNISIRLAQLEAAASRQDTERSATGRAAAPGGHKNIVSGTSTNTAVPIISKGDCVRITNVVKKPSYWNDNSEWNQTKAQRATLTHFYRGQVHFVTDNGIRTWRAINNLARIEHEE
jgi:hypothetical protein